MIKNKQTNWTQATLNLLEAIAGVISAKNAGLNAWIEQQNNGEQDYPIKILNPQLENPFNWQSSYGVPSEPSQQELERMTPTEKELTLNWTGCFGTKEAIEAYQTKGTISKEMTTGMGISHPVKKVDLLKIRPDLNGVNLWTTHWKPKKEFPYWVADTNIKKVFVVCTNHEPVKEDDILIELKSFVNSLTSL